MDDLTAGLGEAARLLLGGDRDVWEVIFLSLRVSLIATLIALGLGVPIGAGLALLRFRGRSLAVGAVYAGMGLPPIVAGLMVSLFLWRNGPFGALGLLYTPTAMVGGNIRGETRVLTTATVLEVSRGHFETAFALSFVLLALTYLVTMMLTLLQRQHARR